MENKEKEQETIEESGTNNALDLCKAELLQAQEKQMRTMADFENYKRRNDQERMRWAQSAQAKILTDLLTIIDDFDRAYAEHAKKEQTPELASWLQGFELIGKSLHKLLDTYQVKKIDIAKEFNPELHEAIVQVESETHNSGDIVEILQNGFTFKGDLLRAARVSVAK